MSTGDQNTENRRFGRIRDFGEDVVDAARAVTGQSARDELEDFTEAYTDAITGIDGDVKELQRRIRRLEIALDSEVSSSKRDIAELRASLRRMRFTIIGATIVAITALILGIVI